MIFRNIFNLAPKTLLNLNIKKQNMSNKIRENLCYTNYDKSRLKIIGNPSSFSIFVLLTKRPGFCMRILFFLNKI